MRQAFLTVDLGFGDAGKGSVVDFLTRAQAAHTVIRYNGGAQAGHRVVAATGQGAPQEHVFAQFGSGALAGAATHLTRYMILDPLAMLAEAAHLQQLGLTDIFQRTTIDAQALVITPFQRAVNRLRELARGQGRHGSCGIGIGETVADSLTYGKSPYRFFSDYPLICTKLPNETARIEFAKVLLRNRTLMARLRPSPKLDRDAMRNYWSVKGKNDGALPLLESITGPGSVEPVDITYLLPPLPRRFLYTYGTREMAVGRDLPDCFWSSLNFFQQEISNRFLDPVVGEILEKEWLPVEPPYQLGDLILIMRVADKEAVHACSYIADDIVFTKNGKSIVRPWVLQRIDDIKHTYYEEGVHSFTVRRHRSLIPRNKATPAAVISAR
ncbi:MAG: adenylosuccinate synthetase [Verrucomicrobiae bacterium]|nr:adenylosuccinate synthetase [Verrucomicrobiae bacterium]